MKKVDSVVQANNGKSLESWIWGAACAIRGADDAVKYKDYILPLIFAKRLCDVFDDEIRRIAEDVGSFEKALKLVEKDPKLVRFTIPFSSNESANGTWSAIRTTASSIGETVTSLLRDIAQANPPLAGIIDRVDFNATTHGQRDLDDDRLSNLIEAISAKRLGLDDVEPDVIGRCYEYLIRKFAEGSGQSAGEFFTPPEVGKVMARLLALEPNMSVYDPCAGSAGLLINCQLTNLDSHPDSRISQPLDLYGQEYLPMTWAMANMNMIIHDMQGEIAIGDSFRHPVFKKQGSLRKFDRVVANPMWNQPWFDEKVYEADTFGRFPFGIPPESTADWGWIQHMLASLKPEGRMAIVLDTAAASRGSGAKGKSREKEIRKQIVEAGLVETVILLPENLFYNTGAPGIVMILTAKPSSSGAVRLVNASNLFARRSPKNYLTDDHIAEVVRGALSASDIDDLCRVIPIDALAEIDFDLSPSRHVPLDPNVPILPLPQAESLVAETYLKSAESHSRRKDKLNPVSMASGVISDLPTDWTKASLSELLEDEISGDWGEEFPPEGGDYLRVAVIRGTDFPQVRRLRFASVPRRFIKRTSFEKRQPRNGDLLIEISGGGKYQNTGRAVFLTDEVLSNAEDPVMFTNFTKLLRVNSSMIVPALFAYHWIHLYDLGRTARYEKQPTNIKNFKYRDFLRHEVIAFPRDLDRQAEIVNALDVLHLEIERAEELQHALLGLRHASLKELLGGSARLTEKN